MFERHHVGANQHSPPNEYVLAAAWKKLENPLIKIGDLCGPNVSRTTLNRMITRLQNSEDRDVRTRLRGLETISKQRGAPKKLSDQQVMELMKAVIFCSASVIRGPMTKYQILGQVKKMLEDPYHIPMNDYLHINPGW